MRTKTNDHGKGVYLTEFFRVQSTYISATVFKF